MLPLAGLRTSEYKAMMTSKPRSGFSLIEALVVLAIGGMALAIIFSIGIKAGDTGFGLGRRAMTASESDVATSDLRTILRSVALRPGSTAIAGIDQASIGDSKKFLSDVVMERATQCAPEGWAGRLNLTIEPRGSGSALVCTAGDRQTTLIESKTQVGAFSYSTDGATWRPTYTNQAVAQQAFEERRSESVWIRFAAPPALDIVEYATSGRPEAWGRLDVE